MAQTCGKDSTNINLGTIFKLLLTFSEFEEYKVGDQDCTLSVSMWAGPTRNNVVTYTKADSNYLMYRDDNCYVLVVDTSLIGRGEFHVQTTWAIPDVDILAADSMRPDVKDVCLHDKIVIV